MTNTNQPNYTRNIMGTGRARQPLNLDEVTISIKEAEELERKQREEQERLNRNKPQVPEEQKGKLMPEETEEVLGANPKADYVYVPALGLYLSEQRNLQGKNWNQTQEILHKENRRMPTIPEFTEFIKYLRSPEGKKNVKNAEAILDEIYKVEGDWRAEHLDAKFEEKNSELYVAYHVFDAQGKIVQKQEKLEAYLAQDKTPGIDLESWLNAPTKQGLPKANCKAGNLYYWSPIDGSVARFYADSDRAIFSCYWDPSDSDPSLGVRYVEPLARGEDRARNLGGTQ